MVPACTGWLFYGPRARRENAHKSRDSPITRGFEYSEQHVIEVLSARIISGSVITFDGAGPDKLVGELR